MFKTEKRTKEVEYYVSFVCDKCKTEIDYNNMIEWQEAYFIKFTGGYGSIFGDMSTVECNLCQHCLNELIGNYCRYIDEY